MKHKRELFSLTRELMKQLNLPPTPEATVKVYAALRRSWLLQRDLEAAVAPRIRRSA